MQLTDFIIAVVSSLMDMKIFSRRSHQILLAAFSFLVLIGCVEDYFEIFVQIYDKYFSKHYGFWVFGLRVFPQRFFSVKCLLQAAILNSNPT